MDLLMKSPEKPGRGIIAAATVTAVLVVGTLIVPRVVPGQELLRAPITRKPQGTAIHGNAFQSNFNQGALQGAVVANPSDANPNTLTAQLYGPVLAIPPTTSHGMETSAFWIFTALTSLIFNGIAAAFLIGRRTPRQSLAMLATVGEVSEEDGAAADEQANSPKAALEVELEEVKAKLAEAEKKYLYALAELETVRRRGRQQVEDARKFGIEKFAIAILEVADNMARGLAWVSKEVVDGPSGPENPNPELRALYGGMRSTEKIMMSVLEKQGIQSYDPLGEIYDPNMARAIAQVPHPEAEPGTVLQVVTLGYTLNGRVLRPADVVVVQEAS